ncbi:MAG: low molecular weight protein-tyrosine-phosphatase [Vampirovibrionales bacterium]|nr:low molecular weight protein-tyrosine-phosphatase [Vampirovibrionales bacterium]
MVNAPLPVKVLFVCMGNICRSPSAEGVFRHVVQQAGLEAEILIDSAGTHDYHVGGPPDSRSQRHALQRGYDLSALRAWQILEKDFDRFDYIYVMDCENLNNVLRICPERDKHKVGLFLALAPHLGVEEVPDPYYGGVEGFEHVLDLIEAASEALLAKLCQDHGLKPLARS